MAHPNRREFVDRDTLDELLQKHTMQEIADQFSVGIASVWRRVKEFGLSRENGKTKIYGPGRRARTEAHNLNMSLSLIAQGTRARERHWNWRGGITLDNLKLRKTREYRLWKKAVLAKSGNRCAECGMKNGHKCECCDHKTFLHAHHIQSFIGKPELRFDVNNGEALCPKCHYSRHRGKPRKFGETANVKTSAIPSQAA